MKRVLFSVGILLTCLLAVCCILPYNYLYYLLGFFAVVTVVFLILSIRFKCLFIINLAFIFSCVVIVAFMIFYNIRVKPVTRLAGEKVTVIGRVCDYPKNYADYSVYEVEVIDCSEPGFPRDFKINCYTTNDDTMDIYDYVTAEVKFSELSASNKLNSLSNEVFIHTSTGNFKYLRKGEPPNFISKITLSVRQKVKKFIRRNSFSEQAGILQALTIGDKSNISFDTRDIFNKCGLSHMLVISGFHLSIIFFSLFKLLKFLGVKVNISAIICIILSIFYACLTGFSSSITRALTAFIIIMLGYVFYKESDSLNSLGLAMIIILLINPFSVCDIGFLLSVTSVVGLVLLSRELTSLFTIRIFKKKFYKTNKIVEIFCQSLSATVFTLPILALSFGRVPVFSPVINVFAYLPIILVMIISIIAVMFSFIPALSGVGGILIYISNVITKYILIALKHISGFKYLTININFKDISLALIISLAIFGICVVIFKSKMPKVLTVFTAFCLILIFAIFNNIKTTDQIAIIPSHFCNVVIKEKHCIVIGSGNGHSDYNNLDKYLKDNKIEKIDVLIIPSENSYVSGGLPYILSNYECDAIITDTDFKIDSFPKNVKVNNIGETTVVADKFHIEFSKNQTDYAVILKVDGRTFVFSYNSCDFSNFKDFNDADLFVTGNSKNYDAFSESKYVYITNSVDKQKNKVYNCNWIEEDGTIVSNLEKLEFKKY